MMRSLDRAKPTHKKPWASLIAIAALVTSVSASAGELDGKQIVCSSPMTSFMYLDEERGLDVVFPPWGFVFQDGAVTAHFFDRSNETPVERKADEGPYSAAPTYVSWGKPPKFRSLNRKKLVVQYGAYEAECRLASSFKVFREMMRAAEDEVQKEMDEQRREREWLMKDNQI